MWGCGVVGFTAWIALVLLPCGPETGILFPPAIPEDGSSPVPPQLDGCTRIEIRFLPSALEALFPGEEDRRLLNSEEIERLRSIRTIDIEDGEQILALAKSISFGRCFRQPIEGDDIAQIACWHGNEQPVSFAVAARAVPIAFERFEFLRTQERTCFPWSGWGIREAGLPPEIRVFVLRRECARTPSRLGPWIRPQRERVVDPAPERWCDGLSQTETAQVYGMEFVKGLLSCPATSERECQYAMNPRCRAGSPPDTVFLFESSSGWNQHGGPELFVFDHHEPGGGCVLLNDGTVRFIRTPEELAQLRWE